MAPSDEPAIYCIENIAKPYNLYKITVYAQKGDGMPGEYQRQRRQRLREAGQMVSFSTELRPPTHEKLRDLAKRQGSSIRQTLESLIWRAANG